MNIMIDEEDEEPYEFAYDGNHFDVLKMVLNNKKIPEEELQESLRGLEFGEITDILDYVIESQNSNRFYPSKKVASIIRNQPYHTAYFADYDDVNTDISFTKVFLKTLPWAVAPIFLIGLVWVIELMIDGTINALELTVSLGGLGVIAWLLFVFSISHSKNAISKIERHNLIYQMNKDRKSDSAIPNTHADSELYYSELEKKVTEKFAPNAEHIRPIDDKQDDVVLSNDTERISDKKDNSDSNGLLQSYSQEALDSAYRDYKSAYQRIASYETDISKAIAYPAFNDVTVSEVSVMIKQLRKCERLFKETKLPTSVDLAVPVFINNIDTLWVDIQAAERAAKKIAWSNVSIAERKDLKLAENLIQQANDAGNTNEMRVSLYSKLKAVIDRLNTNDDIIPVKVIAEIEQLSAKQLSTIDSIDNRRFAV